MCLHADRSILNHAAVNLHQHSDSSIQTTERGKQPSVPIKAAASLPAVTHSTQLYYFPTIFLPPYSHHVWAALRVRGVRVGLDMKAAGNLSDRRASGDQVL